MNDLLPNFLRLRADMVFYAGVVVALAVTFHVLLRKREVASAVV